jgi:hypothetical protein
MLIFFKKSFLSCLTSLPFSCEGWACPLKVQALQMLSCQISSIIVDNKASKLSCFKKIYDLFWSTLIGWILFLLQHWKKVMTTRLSGLWLNLVRQGHVHWPPFTEYSLTVFLWSEIFIQLGGHRMTSPSLVYLLQISYVF